MLFLGPMCHRWSPGGCGVTLCPNPAFLPKVLSPQLINQSIELVALHPPPFQKEEDEGRNLCPVCFLCGYMDIWMQWLLWGRQTSSLSAIAARTKVHPWEKSGYHIWLWRLLIRLRWWSPTHVSRAAFKGVPLSDTCAAVTWAFSRFKVNIVSPHVLGSVRQRSKRWTQKQASDWKLVQDLPEVRPSTESQAKSKDRPSLYSQGSQSKTQSGEQWSNREGPGTLEGLLGKSTKLTS